MIKMAIKIPFAARPSKWKCLVETAGIAIAIAIAIALMSQLHGVLKLDGRLKLNGSGSGTAHGSFNSASCLKEQTMMQTLLLLAVSKVRGPSGM
jgi:hypothetical protein